MTKKQKKKVEVITNRFIPKHDEYYNFLLRENKHIATCYLYACAFKIPFSLEYFKDKDVSTSEIISTFLTENDFLVRDLGKDCEIIFNKLYCTCLDYGIAIHFEGISNKGVSINAPVTSIETSLNVFTLAMGAKHNLKNFQTIHAKVFYKKGVILERFLEFE